MDGTVRSGAFAPLVERTRTSLKNGGQKGEPTVEAGLKNIIRGFVLRHYEPILQTPKNRSNYRIFRP